MKNLSCRDGNDHLVQEEHMAHFIALIMEVLGK
jgi:hypothetical protein